MRIRSGLEPARCFHLPRHLVVDAPPCLAHGWNMRVSLPLRYAALVYGAFEPVDHISGISIALDINSPTNTVAFLTPAHLPAAALAAAPSTTTLPPLQSLPAPIPSTVAGMLRSTASAIARA